MSNKIATLHSDCWITTTRLDESTFSSTLIIQIIKLALPFKVSSTTGSGMLLATNSNGTTATSIHHRASVVDRIHQGHSSPLVLSLSQIHSAGGLSFSQIQDGTNLLILNNPSSGRNSSQPSTSVSMVTNFKCAASATMSNSHQQQPPPPPPPLKQYHHPRNKLTLKHESTDANQMSCCRMTSSSNAKKVGDEGNARNGLPGMTPAFSNSACNGGKSDIGKDLNSVPVTAAKSMGTSGNSGTIKFIFLWRCTLWRISSFKFNFQVEQFLYWTPQAEIEQIQCLPSYLAQTFLTKLWISLRRTYKERFRLICHSLNWLLTGTFALPVNFYFAMDVHFYT